LLSVHQLAVNGRRDPLLPATSFSAARGALSLITGTRQDQRTALALAVTGRMKPSGGSMQWDGIAGIRRLRTASAVVDSPGVNEPEQHLSVRDLVAEDLALIPGRRGTPSVASWLTENGFEDIAGLWVDQLDAGRRLELLTALALSDPGIELLVVDSPDRHSGDPAAWLPRLEALASDAGRPLAVAATLSSLPPGWDGAAAIGNALPESGCRPAPAPEQTEQIPVLTKEASK
jgi:ABC-type transport system involved in cytochrome c biogenesis ATPase subunit